MDKAKKILNWLDKNLLFLLSTFLIAFIPLFPKIPLFDALPGYIVRVRAEDFLILFTAIVWLRGAYKKHFEWNTSFFWLVILYAAIGLLSILMGAFLQQSVPLELIHIGKSGLHFFRYLEYFALFFFLYSAISSKKQIKIVLSTLVITLIGIIAYGFGQQYLHFPLYSTMNREFSKGVTLYLQENARPQSTFAGHYDLGAYLVIVLPIIFSLSISGFGLKKSKQKYLRLLLHPIHAFGAWMLVTSGSKTALAAYLVGILIVLFFNLKRLGNFKQQLKWGGVAFVILMLGLGVLISVFGKETETTLISIAQNNTTANKIISKIPGVSLAENTADQSKPDDLYGEGHEYKLVTKTDEYGNEYKVSEKVGSTWSENALKYGISMGIRLDTLWPQAIKGLINNPLFGNAYGTLSALVEGHFVEADSTDNNYLRSLGETGILGFLSFYGLVLFVLFKSFKNTKHQTPITKTLSIGFVGSVIGLLINASYIDVFAASKVAFSFWALAGLTMKSGLITKNNQLLKESTLATNRILLHLKKHRAFYLGFLMLFFLLHKNPYKTNSLLRNFDAPLEAIENVVAAKCYLNTGSFEVCRSSEQTNLVLRSNSDIYARLLIAFLRLSSDPAIFYFLNLSLLTIVFLVIYKVIAKIVEASKNANHPDLIKLIVLLVPLLSFYLSRATYEPWTVDKILFLVIVTPITTMLFAYLISKRKRRVSVSLQLFILLLFSLSLHKLDFLSDIKTSFRNNTPAYKNWAVRRSTDHLTTKFIPESQNFNYLITNINPFYFDFYKNDQFKLLPMSEQQPYFDTADKVWSKLSTADNSDDISLKKTYQDLIDNNQGVYLLDYGIFENHDYFNSFQNIKDSFDLTYQVIDCDESCNVYSLTTEQEEMSEIPTAINEQELSLQALSGPYSFTVINQRYLQDRKPTDPVYNTKTLISSLKTAGLDSQNQAMMFFTGDIIHHTDEFWKNYFALNFGNIVNFPIFYSAGNFDLIPEKQYTGTRQKFFGEHNYFLIIDLEPDSSIGKTQKLFVYNAFLELEELPNIKNIFIISHNLNWQDQSNPDNFIHNLESKLADFPSLNKFIISANHDINENNENQSHFAYQANEETKTQYFANLENGQADFSYLKFDIDSQSNVSFENLELDLPKIYSTTLQNPELE